VGDRFGVWFFEASDLARDAFADSELVQIEMSAEVTWILDGPRS
jgi:hypothetical protein